MGLVIRFLLILGLLDVVTTSTEASFKSPRNLEAEAGHSDRYSYSETRVVQGRQTRHIAILNTFGLSLQENQRAHQDDNHEGQ